MKNKKNTAQERGEAENEKANYVSLGSEKPVSRDLHLEDKERLNEPEETAGDLAGNALGNEDTNENS